MINHLYSVHFSGFHKQLRADNDNNGFSYKVNVQDETSDSSSNRLPAGPYGASKDATVENKHVITGIPDLSKD